MFGTSAHSPKHMSHKALPVSGGLLRLQSVVRGEGGGLSQGPRGNQAVEVIAAQAGVAIRGQHLRPGALPVATLLASMPL